MRRFHLVRVEDVSGTSGIGVVAEGCQFHTNECVLSWFGNLHSTAIYETADVLLAIHGHDGRTTIKWLDKENQ